MSLAFVVQIERPDDTAPYRVAGRVEHVSTGKSREFSDGSALLQFLDSFGAQTPDAPHDRIQTSRS
ncbi:MAG TPA: hypothetical protein VEB21_11290 [Terriglobales bacterium]|nr:hypothetical protein [Terriglobales bacterium]